MTSKERVRATYKREPVDRIATNYMATGKVTQRLLKDFGFSRIGEISKKFETDIVIAQPRYIGPALKEYVNDDGNTVKETFWGSEKTFVNANDDVYGVNSYHPLSMESTLEEIENFAFPSPDNFDYSTITACCDANPDKGIMIGHPGPFQVITNIMNMEDLFIMMYEEPEAIHTLLENLVKFELEYYKRALEAGGGRVDVVRTCDDYGTQISLLFSVDTWKEFFKENTKALVELVHSYGAFFQQHSCGAVEPLIEQFIECGVDALEPVQKVQGLEVEHLVEKFGGRITFHGGIDTQGLLPSGTPEEVTAECVKFINMLGKNGGYVLMGSQEYEADISTANIEAVYSAPREIK